MRFCITKVQSVDHHADVSRVLPGLPHVGNLDELERRSLRRGLITLCVGGGMGIATIVERV